MPQPAVSPGPHGSLWEATAQPAPDLLKLDGDVDCDVAIVGGGFTGLSAALHLAEQGVDAVVLEGDTVGAGASGRNGGQVIPGLKDDPDQLVAWLGPEQGERLVELVGGTADFVAGLVQKHGIDCDFTRPGWIQAAHAELSAHVVHKRAEQWAGRGAPVEPLSKAQVEEHTGSPGYAGGLLDRRAGTLQPLSYVRGLARAASKAGARIFEHAPATGLEQVEGGWRVKTPRGQVKAEQVVLATNGYTGDLWPGLAQSILPVRSIQGASQPLSDNVARSILPNRSCISETRKLTYYFRVDKDNRLLIGGRGPLGTNVPEAMFRHLAKGAERLFPQLPPVKWSYKWSGRVALTTDHLPHLHELAPGLWTGLGYNGRGVGMATVMGSLLAEQVTRGAAAEHPFPVTRLQPIPFHGLRQPALAAAIVYYRIKDRLGFPSN